VKEWKYQLYLLNQKPVEAETIVGVAFTLADNKLSHKIRLAVVSVK